MVNYIKKTGKIVQYDDTTTRIIVPEYFPVYDYKGDFVGEIIDGVFTLKESE